MEFCDIEHITPYRDVNDLLFLLSKGLRELLGAQLAGLYLTGSLTYGGFDRGSSDIDFLAIVNRALSSDQLGQVRSLHARIGDREPRWAKRIEGSYITTDMLESTDPPETPRPYLNGGDFWNPDPRYGNEWLLNLYVLRECGVALVGPDPKVLIRPIDIEDVRRASRRDLLEEWEPKLTDRSFFENSHHQAYVVLTLCRILHRARNDEVASKRIASAWVKRTYGRPWSGLIERAENWQHGREMDRVNETMDFVRFTLEQLK